MERWTLRRRVNTLLVLWFTVFVIVVVAMSSLWISKLRAAEEVERLMLARTIAKSLDALVTPAMQNLERLPQQIPDIEAVPPGLLRSFRVSCPFRSAVYVLDGEGRVLASDPEDVEPIPPDFLGEHVAVTPLFAKSGHAGRMSAAVVLPLERNGQGYWIVAEVDPGKPPLASLFPRDESEAGLHVLLVDKSGFAIAADESTRVYDRVIDPAAFGGRGFNRQPFVARHIACPVDDESGGTTDQLMAVAPLASAPWAVIVMQHESRVLAPLLGLGRGVAAVALLLVVMGLLLSVVLTRSVVSPISKLSVQAEALRDGDLSSSIAVHGDHEIVLLSSTLESARRRISGAMSQLEDLNRDLEQMVANRTARVAEQYRNLQLLHEVAQESVRERELDRLVPRVLELFTSHYGLEAAALEVGSGTEGERLYIHPEAVTIPELASGSLPPGWAERRIEYLGRQLARLLHPRRASIDSSVMQSLEHQLAVAIHSAELWGRTVRQDRERQVLVSRLINASEEERKRIARELHDEIAQLLVVIQLSLEKVEAQTPAVERAKRHVENIQGEVRKIIRDLRPSAIDDLGLPAVITSHVESNLVAHGIAVNLEIERDVSASPEVGIAVFRVFQELVTNVLRHAKAEHVSVELYRDGHELVLVVEDDGVGFDASDTKGGAGLVGIRERAAMVGGEVTVDSEPGMGTNVVVRVRDEP